ncbi:MAG: hypothetical protein EHM21_05540 [Chloroflexi bacterium]|nr:MAG: hypothetical protein EHM21_05540 [Chloroflexota bacterium]
MVDGNAVAGLLQEIFAIEMTVAPARCANCGREGEMGSLHAYLHGPGIVLRCPACEHIVLRIVRTPRMTYVDARGASFWCIPV